MDMRDIQIVIPAEYAGDFLKVIGVGLQRTKLTPEAKKNLQAWWDVETSFINEEIDIQNKGKNIKI
jgi:hypothetical protein